jgi:oligopeptide transport system substrate-binding protein
VKKLTLFLLSIVLVIAVAGCNHSGSALPAAGGSGTLNLYNVDPLTLDPATAGDATSNGYVLELFSGLVRLDANLEPVGDLASAWQVSPDGLVYTFDLRHDAVFQDGRKVTAGDVKYSWERACNPATNSQTAGIYLGDVLGAADMLAGKSQGLSGVQVIDDYTLKVTLSGPSSAFLSKLTYPTAFVVDKANVASGASWWRSPNGTGPFRLSSWTQGTQLVLERNPLYYGDRAKLNKVVYKLLSGIPMNLYESGSIDVADVDIAYYDRVMDPAGPFFSQLSITPVLDLTYLGFDVTKPPFDDVSVRLAFAMTVDKQKLANLMFRDVVTPAGGILPPGMPGYNTALKTISYDVAAAKALLTSSKYGPAANLPPIIITTGGYGGLIPGDLAAIVYDWDQAFGIDIEVRQLDPFQFSYDLKQEKDNMFYWGWSADYAHPQDFLEVLFGTGTTYNIGGYTDSQVDGLLKQAAAATDQAASFALYQQAEQILVNDVACIPLWNGKNMQLVQTYVKGYSVNELGEVALNEVYIQK